MNNEKIKNIIAGLNPKLKSPYFWISALGILLAGAGVDMEALTSWNLLGQALLGILQNPVAIISCIVAFLGVYNDNSSKGMDREKMYINMNKEDK